MAAWLAHLKAARGSGWRAAAPAAVKGNPPAATALALVVLPLALAWALFFLFFSHLGGRKPPRQQRNRKRERGNPNANVNATGKFILNFIFRAGTF